MELCTESIEAAVFRARALPAPPPPFTPPLHPHISPPTPAHPSTHWLAWAIVHAVVHALMWWCTALLSTRHPWSAAPPRAGLSLPHHPYFQLQRSTFTRKRTSSSPSSPSSSPSAFAGRSRGSRCSRARPFWCHPSPLVAWSCGAVAVGRLANVVGGDVGPTAAPEQMMRRTKRAPRGKQPRRLAIMPGCVAAWTTRRTHHRRRGTESVTSEADAGRGWM